MTLFRVSRLKMEGFMVHRDGKSAIILVVYPDNGPLQSDASSAYPAHHFLFGLKKCKTINLNYS